MGLPLLGRRWRITHRGRFTGRYKLTPVGEYGPLPKTGEEVVPAEALSYAIEGLRESREVLALPGTSKVAAARTIGATLRDLGVES